jgi:PAS domain S-box-containing protein
VENSADIIALLDGTLRVRYVNQGLARALGYPPGDCIGRPLSDYAHPEDLAALESLRARADQQRGTPQHGSLRLVARGGEPRTIELALTNHTDNPALGVLVCNARDVTEQRRLQARLQLSDRMASVGTLAAGVAHEINNPLAVVVGNLEVLADRVARGPADGHLASAEIDELLRDAREAAERVRVTVCDLKLFSRGEAAQRKLVELRPLLGTSLRLARDELRHHARVTTHLDEVPLVVANEARLGQAFISLIVNAARAIPDGHAGDDEIRIATFTDADGRAAVEISDSGPGVAPEILGHIFDPFFTTRAPSVSAGLGLAICHQIVSEHGGRIAVESHLGFGTTFRITLPPAGAPAGRDDPPDR